MNANATRRHSPRPTPIGNQPQPPGGPNYTPPTEEDMQRYRNAKILRDIGATIAFLALCVAAGFLVSVGQHYALKMFG